MRYQLTASAERDIREIIGHIRIAQHSPQNARLVATRLTAQFRKIASSPGIGFVHPQLKDASARVSLVSGLLVIYDPGTKPLLVLRVIHPARNLGAVIIPRK